MTARRGGPPTDTAVAVTASPADIAADRANSMLVVVVLVVDAGLLAMMELMFATLAVGTVPVPVSALVALVTTPWLVRRAGELGGRWAAAAPLVVWALTIGVLGMSGPGGDILLIADWPSLLLLAAGLIPGAFVLGRALRAQSATDPTASSASRG